MIKHSTMQTRCFCVAHLLGVLHPHQPPPSLIPCNCERFGSDANKASTKAVALTPPSDSFAIAIQIATPVCVSFRGRLYAWAYVMRRLFAYRPHLTQSSRKSL